MVGVEAALEIRVLHRHGKSIREIARETGVARNTVRRYLRDEEAARYKPRPPRLAKLDPFRAYVAERLGSAAPEWIPASVLLMELRERGYTGGYTMLKLFVASLRPQHAAVFRHDRPQVPIQVARPSKGVTEQPGALPRSPGKVGRAAVEGSEQCAAVRAEDLPVPGEDLGKIAPLHGSHRLRRQMESFRRHCSPRAHQSVFGNESVAPVERLARGCGVQAYALGIGQGFKRRFHQLRSNARAPLQRIHQHHRKPTETPAVAQKRYGPHHHAILLSQPAAPVRRIEKASPVVLDLVPVAEAAEAQSRGDVVVRHGSKRHSCGRFQGRCPGSSIALCQAIA